MRFSILASMVVLVACQKAPGTGDDTTMPDAADPNGTAAFTIQSTDIVLTPNQEVTYCYYFHTPNTSPLAINKWVSDMTPGSHHMIFFTGGPAHADGVDMSGNCGIGGSVSNISQWVFSSQIPHQEQLLPADDGTGKPLAQLIQPNTQGSFQMHYLNATDAPVTVHVKLSAYALEVGAPYTQTDAFITYNQDIKIPAGAVNFPVNGKCAVPAGKFWTVSTHAHKQEISADINDGANTVFHSTEWEHPGAQVWSAAPFYTFTNQISWTCTYNNNGNTAPPDNSGNMIVAGQSAQTNEMCMAVGYFFPSTGPKACINLGPGSCYCN